MIHLSRSDRTPSPRQPDNALEWVDWHNHRRLHSACHDLTPAEYELIHYGQHPALTEAGVSTT
jgi:transposase InsO family protein